MENFDQIFTLVAEHEGIGLNLDILETGLGKKIDRDFFPWRKGDQKIYVSDITKATEILDWKPKIGVMGGIKKIIDHIKTAVKVNIKNPYSKI